MKSLLITLAVVLGGWWLFKRVNQGSTWLQDQAKEDATNRTIGNWATNLSISNTPPLAMLGELPLTSWNASPLHLELDPGRPLTMQLNLKLPS